MPCHFVPRNDSIFSHTDVEPTLSENKGWHLGSLSPTFLMFIHLVGT